MASKSACSDSPKRSKSGARVLGRSAATGGLILAPVSKGGFLSIRKTRAAVKSLRLEKR